MSVVALCFGLERGISHVPFVSMTQIPDETMIKVKCPHCSKEMNIGDEYAGKKIRCPACKEVVAVDGPPTAVQPAPAPKPPAPIREVSRPPIVKRQAVVEDEKLAEVMAQDDEREGMRRLRSRDHDEEEDDDRRRMRARPRRGRQGDYADCPGCGAPGDAKRVTFTWWGGALGPWLFCHVRCSHCGTCYNGRTGQSNTTAIAIYTAAGLFIGLALGAVLIILAAIG
jgi:hypothetical protein